MEQKQTMKQFSIFFGFLVITFNSLKGQEYPVLFTKEVEATIIMKTGDTLKGLINFSHELHAQDVVKLINNKKVTSVYTPLQVEKYYFTLKDEL